MSVEDKQAEANEKAIALIAQLPEGTERTELTERLSEACEMFSEGYDSDNDNLMYDGLGEMREIVDELGGECVE